MKKNIALHHQPQKTVRKQLHRIIEIPFLSTSTLRLRKQTSSWYTALVPKQFTLSTTDQIDAAPHIELDLTSGI